MGVFDSFACPLQFILLVSLSIHLFIQFCLGFFSIDIKRYSDHGNLRKKAFIGTHSSEGESTVIMQREHKELPVNLVGSFFKRRVKQKIYS